MPQTLPATTPNLGLELLENNATGQSTRANGSIQASDALLHLLVLDKDLNTPPGAPTSGDRYIVGASPTGAWTGKAKYVAGWYNSAWLFWAPKNGMQARVSDESKDYQYDGANWVEKTATVTTAPTWTAVSKTSSFTASVSEAAVYLIDGSSGDVIATLPAAAGVGSRVFILKRTDTSVNAVTVDGNASETIDGELTVSLNPLESITIVSSGTDWYIL